MFFSGLSEGFVSVGTGWQATLKVLFFFSLFPFNLFCTFHLLDFLFVCVKWNCSFFQIKDYEINLVN